VTEDQIKARKSKACAVSQARYFARKAQGLCTWGACAEPIVATGSPYCSAHKIRSRQNIRTLLDDRVARGLCRQCGETRGDSKSSVYCVEHRLAANFSSLKRRVSKPKIVLDSEPGIQ
jgi:hypothetical protein